LYTIHHFGLRLSHETLADTKTETQTTVHNNANSNAQLYELWLNLRHQSISQDLFSG